MVAKRSVTDTLIARLQENRDDDATAQLLAEFHGGLSVDRLRELLTCPDGNAVRAGVWIASELGTRIRPVLAELAPLLRHPDRYVRFFVLDCVLVAADEGDGALLASAAELFLDPDAAVRWKAMNLLASASQAQLDAAGMSSAGAPMESELSWLSNLDLFGSESVWAKLRSSDEVETAMAAVAAARLATEDASLLQFAAQLDSAEVRDFASERLARIDASRGSGGRAFE